MSVLPQLEHDLQDAARRMRVEQATPRDVTSRSVSRRGRSRLRHGLRHFKLLLLSLVGIFASTAIALAATGVIPIGAPVPPSAKPTSDAGVGVPASGGARLLTLRTPDPEGGLSWGLRLVRTTRSELCIQLGRVEDGELGELGIDGAFGDDGRFHPVTSGNLPGGKIFGSFASSTHASCTRAGDAVAGNEPAVWRNAAGQWLDVAGTEPRLRHLRDVYYGVLGPEAVSVTYRDGSSSRTVAVERGTGAYLIVLPASRALLTHGGTGSAPHGELPPSSYGRIITAITYRIHGKLCERGDSSSLAMERAVAHPCPTVHSQRTSLPPPRELRQRVNVQLQLHRDVVAAAKLSFKAPYAVTGVGDDYSIHVESCRVKGDGLETLRAGASIDRDVRRGARISYVWRHPFGACDARAVTFDVLYEREGGAVPPLATLVVVGSASVARPRYAHAARSPR